LTVGDSVTPNTLRAHFEQLRAQGTTCTLEETVGFLVPLTVELSQRHAAGEALFVNPSTISLGEGGFFRVDPGLAQIAPTLPRDRACLAPEERSGLPGNARASVYAIGALLYEALTGASVGPGMRRPTELNPAIPASIELLLAKALVADPSHRPDDLLALAQALHHLAPQASLPPPPADESHLDGGADFTVDVSMSMLPPNRRVANSPYDVAVQDKRAQPARDDRVVALGALKEQLESDPRARYVVVKDGMDHGPFRAIELLQQIATHGFVDSDLLRDSLSNDERAIKDWDQFAPFAEQARLHRDMKAEKAALERTVVREQRSTRGKAFFGIIALGALLAVGVVWYFTVRGSKKDDVDVQGETATNVEMEGALKGRKRAGGAKGGGVVGTQGGFPMLGGGMSCEAAQNAYVEEMKIGQRGQADLTAGQYGAILNSGQYLGACGVPSSMGVNICAAVQNGHAVGVTVTTTPRNPGIAGCIAGAVRRINFPSHPKLDVTRTNFAPAQ
jgi:eukaryotic-like serine/threonine-protein kinase